MAAPLCQLATSRCLPERQVQVPVLEQAPPEAAAHREDPEHEMKVVRTEIGPDGEEIRWLRPTNDKDRLELLGKMRITGNEKWVYDGGAVISWLTRYGCLLGIPATMARHITGYLLDHEGWDYVREYPARAIERAWRILATPEERKSAVERRLVRLREKLDMINVQAVAIAPASAVRGNRPS
jgi:hypothetical protein